MNIFGPLPEATSRYQHVAVITDRYSKLIRAIPSSTTTSTLIANTFLNRWIILYSIPFFFPTNDGTQIVSVLFATLCCLPGVKHLMEAAYRPPTSVEAKRHNKMMVIRLRHYVAEHQYNKNKFVQPLTYMYYTKVHRSNNTTPCSLMLY